ncbi:APC family permease [Halalkaliarchaeum sp. AArc-GB]|uniref:APC family permease n=1 Tax=Halalkaliarchaeum sp. AArc-GB TaxID=3074078 RepID=UPI002859C711|nr:APC family permease [Halalkaliarchaeum sp. AArc-GB]MDR5671961.1 APC family permease [Halalkaliarchaeum sp. AArc-GB]
MPTGLKRDLGLPATTAIAIGAMVGSGIFILPGVAFVTVDGGHPSVVMAFLVSGVLVLPAALSAAEMATAMPEDGGSYVYVERGMGPLLGTIAGLGNWFMLSFKGALALIGGMPYLVFLFPRLREVQVPVFGDPIVPFALVLAVGFVVLNAVSTSSTGRLQFLIVGLMLVVMAWFVAGGFGEVQSAQIDGAFAVGESGFLAATALVFISYAGVIKIAAVAEEVKDPGRVIPRAMVGSLVLTTVIYVATVYVAIGVVDVAELSAAEAADVEAYANGLLTEEGEGPIMAIAARETLGSVGVVGVTIAALLALASTANAGLLSGSRFPFAMARDDLAPAAFERVSDRFHTPVLAVGVTGGMILFMVAFLPISEVAKFGSAFQILVFVLVNLALVGFREGAIEEYDPEFTSPLYPWMQVFGMVSGIVVLTQVGTVPLVGAAVIVAVGVAYYFLYARGTIDREGAVRAGVRESLGVSAVDRTRRLFQNDAEYDVLVAITDRTPEDTQRNMLRISADLGRLRTTVVSLVKFFDVPRRVFDEDHPEVHAADVPDWFPTDSGDTAEWFPENGTVRPATRPSGGQSGTVRGSAGRNGPTIEYREIDSRDHERAMIDVAAYGRYDLLVVERRREELHRRLFGSETDEILANAPCDVLLVEDRGFDGIDEVAVVTTRGPYDPLKLLIADAIGEETGAEINLLQAIPENPPETQRRTVANYHDELISLCTVPTRSTVVESEDGISGLVRFVGTADLLVTGVDRGGFRGRVLGRPGDLLVDSVDCTAVMVQTHEDTDTRGPVGRFLMDYLFD